MITVESTWEEFKTSLAQLPKLERVCFAHVALAAASTYYSLFCKKANCSDPNVLSELTESSWKHLENRELTAQVRGYVQRLERASAELESSDDELAAVAQEACFAGLVICEIWEGNENTEQVMRVLRFLRDITDLVIQQSDDFEGDAEDLEKHILAQPLMTRTLQKLRDSISVVTSQQGLASRISQLRALATMQ